MRRYHQQQEITMSALTETEKSILTNALQGGGEIGMMSAGQIGDWVRAGTFDFVDDNDPSLQARGIEALENLVRKGLVRHETGQLYKLTGSGFDQAKA